VGSRRPDSWSLRAQRRLRDSRCPWLDGFLESGADTRNSYQLLRTKLHLGHQQSEGASYYVEGRDSRSWNDQRRPEPEEDTLELHQAYGVFGDLVRYPATLKVGRQELSYGDERLIGASDWSNVDACSTPPSSTTWVTVGGWTRSRRAPCSSTRTALTAGTITTRFSDLHLFRLPVQTPGDSELCPLSQHHWQVSRANSGGSPQSGGPSARDIITVGARIRAVPGEYGGWEYESEVVNQYGTINVAASDWIMSPTPRISPAVTRGATPMGRPRVQPRYNYSTGDDSRNDGSNETPGQPVSDEPQVL